VEKSTLDLTPQLLTFAPASHLPLPPPTRRGKRKKFVSWKGENSKPHSRAGERFGERSKLYRTQGENRYIRKAKEYWADYEKRENAN
jgi:hypothetical protein